MLTRQTPMQWVDPPSGDAQAAWNGLTNALGGLFGASLNFLESPLKHLHPVSSLPPTSSYVIASLDRRNGSNPTQFFGTLPREVACTENLTPWLKVHHLLPSIPLRNPPIYPFRPSPFHSFLPWPGQDPSTTFDSELSKTFKQPFSYQNLPFSYQNL